MNILILGGTGMLGHKLYQILSRQHTVFATVRGDVSRLRRFNIFDLSSLVGDVYADDADSLQRAFDISAPDVVLNCIGLIKRVPGSQSVIESLTLNSIFPHRASDLCRQSGARFITVSTDCVFDGSRGPYSEDEVPNARDLYGMSKLLGEVDEPHALTLRTSVIGRELSTQRSIVEWFLSHKDGSVQGFSNALYTGFPTIVFGEIISMIVTRFPDLRGVYHVSSDPISKYELLKLIKDMYASDVEVERDDRVAIDRRLDSSRFRSATGFQPPEWREMISRMAADGTPYESFHQEMQDSASGS